MSQFLVHLSLQKPKSDFSPGVSLSTSYIVLPLSLPAFPLLSPIHLVYLSLCIYPFGSFSVSPSLHICIGASALGMGVGPTFSSQPALPTRTSSSCLTKNLILKPSYRVGPPGTSGCLHLQLYLFNKHVCGLWLVSNSPLIIFKY